MTSRQNYISTNPTSDIGPSVSALNRMTPKNFGPKNKDITLKRVLENQKAFYQDLDKNRHKIEILEMKLTEALIKIENLESI